MRGERAPNLIGQTFGMLTVVCRAANGSRGGSRWNVRCACGEVCTRFASNLLNGQTWSCGCRRRTEKPHCRGAWRQPEYASWRGMIDRCHNHRCKDFANYGGRGISVCPRWRESFEAFISDVGRRPSPDHSIDRFPNNDGNYEPGNCRWATNSEQARNKRNGCWIELGGKRATLAEWAECTGLSAGAIKSRIENGWTVVDALTMRSQKDEIEHAREVGVGVNGSQPIRPFSSGGVPMLSVWVPSGVVSIPDRGPRDPGPLGCRVEWRPESPRPWWLIDADGAVLAMADSIGAAQAELAGNVIPKEVGNG